MANHVGNLVKIYGNEAVKKKFLEWINELDSLKNEDYPDTQAVSAVFYGTELDDPVCVTCFILNKKLQKMAKIAENHKCLIINDKN